MNNCFNRTEYYAYHAGHLIPMGSPHADVPEYTVYDSVTAASAGYTSSDQYIPTNKYVHDWVNSNYIRIGVFTTKLSYSSGYHKDINVTQLSGKSSVLGVISVNAFGTRRNASIGVVSGTTSAYTISVSIYNAEGGGGVPAGIDDTYVQVWYYY